MVCASIQSDCHPANELSINSLHLELKCYHFLGLEAHISSLNLSQQHKLNKSKET